MKNKILPLITILVVLIAIVIILVTPEDEKGINSENKIENTLINESATVVKNTIVNQTVSKSNKIKGTLDESGNLLINLEQLDTENATFISINLNDTEMELVAIKDENNNIDVAFNTCVVCNGAPKAYFAQKNEKLVCENCKNTFSFKSIGASANGCNPITIEDTDVTKTDTGISISKEYLQSNSNLFLNVIAH